MSTATDLLKNLNGNTYNASTNPYGLDGVGGMDANLVAGFNAMGTAGDEVSAASALAVPAATTATNAATTATTQAAIAVAAANTAAGIVQHVQPSEIAGIPPIIDFVFSAATAVPSGVITGSSGKWVMGPNGLLTLVPAGTAPIDYDPITSVVRGLLVEESRTNLLVQSRNFSSTSWGALTGVSATQNAVGPDGVANSAWTIADTSAAGFGERYQDVTVANDTATRLFWVLIKAGTSTRVSVRIEYIGGTGVSGSIDVNPSAGTIVSQVGSIGGFVPLYGGWYLAYIALANNGSGNTVCRGHIIPSPVSAADQTTVVVYHAQLEPGTFPTSMVPTTTGTVNRAGDLNSLLLSSVSGWNAAEGTLYLECDTLTTASSSTEQYFMQLDDGTQNNRIAITRVNGVARAYGVVSGSTVFDFSLGAWTTTAAQKIALGFANNSFIANLNGAAVQTDLSGAVPTLTTLRLGCAATGTNQANGRLRRATLWGRQLASPIYPLLTA